MQLRLSNDKLSPSGGKVFMKFDQLNWWVAPFDDEPADGRTVEFSTVMNRVQCGDSVDGVFPVREYAAIVDGHLPSWAWLLGMGDIPVFAGKFQVQCVKGSLRWDPGEITVGDDRGTGREVELRSKGAVDDTWKIEPGSWSDWLTMVGPSNGVLAVEPAEDSRTIKFRLKEAEDYNTCHQPRSASVIASSRTRGQAALTITEPPPCFIRWSESKVADGGTVQLITSGHVDDAFTISAVPSWVSMSGPTQGILVGDGHEKSLSYTFSTLPRQPQCMAQPMTVAYIHVGTETRGSSDLMVTARSVPGDSSLCPKQKPDESNDPNHPDYTPPTQYPNQQRREHESKSVGDPHMYSFDNKAFDAMVMGEYTYIRSTTPGSDLQVDVLHDVVGKVTGLTATAAIGVAIRSEGHRLEVVPRQTSKVLVDGVETSIDVPFQVGGITVFSPRPGQINVSTDEFTGVFYFKTFSSLDVYFSADTGAPLVGMLGSPDGEFRNDFRTPDGLVEFSPWDMHVASDELQQFAASWRITDRADSLFTTVGPEFSANNPPWNPTALNEWRQQVTPLLASVANVCDTSASTKSWVLDGLATELAIGRQLSDLIEYTCHYRVSGLVSGAGFGVPFATVTVTSPGFIPCTTTTFHYGGYNCELTPDPAQLGTPPPTPLTFSVTVTDGANTVATGTGTTTELASVGLSYGVNVDAEVDPGLIPLAEISGSLFTRGEPITGALPLRLIALDADGAELLHAETTIVPRSDGTYRSVTALPLRTRAVRMSGGYSDAPGYDPLPRTVAIEPGVNQLTFDLDYRPIDVTVSGTMERLGQPITTPTAVEVRAYNADGVVSPTGLMIEPYSDGHYSQRFTVPADTVSVEATAEVGAVAADYVTTTRIPVAVGDNPLPLSFDYQAKSIQLSGTLQRNGVPITTPVSLIVRAKNASGDVVYTVTKSVTPDAGAYSLAVELPSASVSADVEAEVGPTTPDHPRSSPIDVSAPGDYLVPFGFDFQAKLLQVNGAVTRNGAPITEDFMISYRAENAGGELLTTGFTYAEADTLGNFATIPVELPLATQSVSLVAALGATPVDYPQTTITGGFVSGTNAKTWDIAYNPSLVKVTGTLVRGDGSGLASATVWITPRDAQGAQIGNSALLASVTPDPATGAYSVTIEVPTTSVTADVRLDFSPFSVDDMTATVTTTMGQTSTVPFDTVVFDPPVLNISGAMTSFDDTPLSGTRPLTIEASDGSGVIHTLTTQVELEDNGHYSFTTTLPNVATSARLSVAFPGVTPTVSLDVEHGEQNVSWSPSDSSKQIELSGTIRTNSQPVSGTADVRITSRDAANTVLAEVTRTLTLAADGRYRKVLPLPEATTTVDMVALLGGVDDPTKQITDIVQGIRPVEWNIEHLTNPVRLQGDLSINGVAVTTPVLVTASFTIGDEAGQQPAEWGTVPVNGHYVIDKLVPIAATAMHVELTLYQDGRSKTYTADVTGLTPATLNEATLNAAWIVRTLIVTGTVTRGGNPAPNTSVQIDITYSSGPDNAPLTISTEQLVAGTDQNGQYSKPIDVPADAVRAVVTVGATGSTSSTSTVVLEPYTTSMTAAALTLVGSSLTFSGTVVDRGLPSIQVRLRVQPIRGTDWLPTVIVDPSVDANGTFAVTTPYDGTADKLRIDVLYRIAGDPEGNLSRSFGWQDPVAVQPSSQNTFTLGQGPFTEPTRAIIIDGFLVDGSGTRISPTTPAPVLHFDLLDPSGAVVGHQNTPIDWYQGYPGEFGNIYVIPRYAGKIRVSVNGSPAQTFTLADSINAGGNQFVMGNVLWTGQ